MRPRVLVAGMAVAACLAAGCSTEAEPAPLADAPATPDAELATATLLAPGDLPSGFEVGPDLSTVPDDDPDVCDAFRALDDRFGPSSTQWGITYSQNGTYDSVTVRQTSVVWLDAVARQRSAAAVAVGVECFPARIETNLRTNLPPTPVDVVSVEAEELEVGRPDGALVTGVRVRATLREAGLEYPVFYDFLYVPHDRITVVLELRRAIEPVDTAFESELVGLLAERIRDVQR